MELATLRDGVDLSWGDSPGSVGTTKLPGELMIEILVRLPIISILRFKSVCKAWYRLFTIPIFIRHHSLIAGSRNELTDQLSMLVHIQKYQGHMWSNQIFSLFLEHSFEKPIMKSMELPIEGDCGYINVLGCINGLVSLSLCPKAKFIVLWNPATRKHCRIPCPQLPLASEESVSLGFAYDEKTDCYKIVRILSFDSVLAVPPVPRLEIYSTGTNTWRTADTVNFPLLYSAADDGEVVSGVPYWYAIYFNPRIGPDVFQDLIVCFDASAESFRFHPLQPADTDDVSLLSQPVEIGYFYRVSLAAMGEHPAVMFMKYGIISGGVEWVDIRKFKFDAGKDTFRIQKWIGKAPPCSRHISGFGRNDEIVAADKDNTLRLYGQEDPKDLAVYDRLRPKVHYYNESLVWPSTLY